MQYIKYIHTSDNNNSKQKKKLHSFLFSFSLIQLFIFIVFASFFLLWKCYYCYSVCARAMVPHGMRERAEFFVRLFALNLKLHTMALSVLNEFVAHIFSVSHYFPPLYLICSVGLPFLCPALIELQSLIHICFVCMHFTINDFDGQNTKHILLCDKFMKVPCLY